MERSIVVMGGSFNPPTIAHGKLLRAAMDALGAEKGIFVPTAGKALRRKMRKAGTETDAIPDEMRLKMLRAMAEDDTGFEVCDAEMRHPKGWYTFETMEYIQEQYPDFSLFFLAGADSMGVLLKGHRLSAFLERFSFAIFRREGGDPEPMLRNCPEAWAHRERFHIFSQPEQTTGISSTAVRRLLHENPEKAAHMLHPAVMELLLAWNNSDAHRNAEISANQEPKEQKKNLQKKGRVDMIDVTLLGTSALVPLPERALTALYLVCGGRSILFDCGEGTQSAARKAGVGLINTEIIALTHYHGDHIFGLPGLLQTMNSMGRTEPLTIIGPAGLETELAPILTLAGWLAYELKLLEISEDGVELNAISAGWPAGARLIPVKTEHRVISQGYVFHLPRAGKFAPEKAKALGVPTNQWSLLQKGQTVRMGDQEILPEMVMGAPRKGLKVVFTGDTSRCDTLVQAAQEADLLISEATYGENEQAERATDHGHMNFAQAAQLAADAQAKRLWLVHYSQMIENPGDYLPNAQVYFPTAECGFDGKQIKLQFDK